MAAFEPVDTKVSFPSLERDILAWWKDVDVFRRSLELRADAPEWIFYEGPPTANGAPGVHHVEPRTFKDVYPRYKTMTGHLVNRKAGWDCHGLPVELEVEKEIGTTGKQDIEAFGVAEFNALCRASVQRYVGEFERLTERIGFWIDMSQAYWTMDTAYIESVWWSLQQLHRRGLLVEDHKVTAYCPRCGTALSDAEVAKGYRTVQDPSVFVRFPVVEPVEPGLADTSLVVWTTTPWTLPSNTGVAVDPDAAYVLVEREGDRIVLGEPLVEPVLGDGWLVRKTFAGRELVGSRYAPPFPNVEGAHTVVAASFVSMSEGTGIVHLAPAFGPDDLAVGREQGWPVWKPVGDDGRFTDDAPDFVRGLFVKDADPPIVEDLRTRNLLIREATYEHAYPFCWRCSTPLLYYARTSWYVRTTAVKERLLEVNGTVNWYPNHIKDGRYGNWLANNVDWALSRERYWGTPLPIWRCAQGHATAVGSLEELGRLAGRDVSDVDPHRPTIDEVTIACPDCGERAARVPEVIDAWYDSGAMPFAQWGYHPDLGRGRESFESSFPADFISEAIDQTRGWFYTLMAEGVLHFDSTTYRNCVCLGHLVAADGQKMSKSLGNTVDPFEVLDRQGADALRWFMVVSGSPWEQRRIGHEILDEIVRQVLLTLWNVYAFFVTYANAGGFDPETSPAPAPNERPLLDRWALSQLAGTTRYVRERMDDYDATAAGRRIQAFVDDLSNWYVRRSRRRFWDPDGHGGAETASAYRTLWECLVGVAGMLAPFMPFVSEALWRNLAAARDGRPDSVHLSWFPEVHEAAVDPGLDEAMAAARHLVELGRRVRVETKTRTRQPLAEAVVHTAERRGELDDLLPLIAEELNVRRVRFAGPDEAFGIWRAKPAFRTLGPRLGPRVKALAAALERDDGSLAGRLAAGATVEVAIDDGPQVAVGPEDVELLQEVLEGWGVASEGGVTVALELEVTAELRLEGIARELVRAIQDERKAAGLDVTDRIVLGIVATGEVAEALERHADVVAAETLATELVTDRTPPDAAARDVTVDGRGVTIGLRRA
ncbi:MAG TPA: isoleucine--tRNA ligase [Actinomycetota bacterium]|jgi:isoleucyl-tRNA synthetase